MLRLLVLRDLQRQYRKFRLGPLWTIIEPLGMAIVLWFVFSMLLGRRKLGLQPYLLFLSIAILPWWWFTKGIAGTARVFQKNLGQLRVSLLPTELWVLRILLQVVLMYGLGLLIASWAVVVPDLARIVRIVMRALFCLTPVLYSITNIPERIRPFAVLNPLVAPLGLYRVGWCPEEDESLFHFGISFALCHCRGPRGGPARLPEGVLGGGRGDARRG